MKINRKGQHRWFLGGTLLLLTATPSFALFGFGDIVFDPTSYGSLASQLSTLRTQYDMLRNNIEHFSLKQQWRTTFTALENVAVRNTLGETNGMTAALNGNSPSTASTAWNTATVPISSDAGRLWASTMPLAFTTRLQTPLLRTIKWTAQVGPIAKFNNSISSTRPRRRRCPRCRIKALYRPV